MATHSSVLAWRIPGTGEPGGRPSMGSHRVGHDWSDLAAAWSNDEETPGKNLNKINPEVQWSQRICSRITPLGKARAGVHSFYPHTRTGTQTWVVLRKLKEPQQGPAPSTTWPWCLHPLSTALRLWAGHFSAQKPFMTPLSLWTKANFTICS